MRAVRVNRLSLENKIIYLSRPVNPGFRVRGVLAELVEACNRDMTKWRTRWSSMLMLTWGRRDGDVQNPVLYEDS